MSTFSTSSRQESSKPSVFYTFDFEMCFAPQRRALFRHFFDIWTSKSGPRPSVFNTCDLEMCFARQRRALFRHLNFKKWSGPGVFCTFWLGNVLRATTACTFSTSQLPKVVRPWCVLYILTWKCASRHNGVQFFIAPVASWLRTRRFSEPTFRPSGATNHWKKTQCFATFLPVRASASSFFWSCLFWLFSPLLFNCPYCLEVSLLNFLRSKWEFKFSMSLEETSNHVNSQDLQWTAVIAVILLKFSCWPRRLLHPLSQHHCRSSNQGRTCPPDQRRWWWTGTPWSNWVNLHQVSLGIIGLGFVRLGTFTMIPMLILFQCVQVPRNCRGIAGALQGRCKEYRLANK